MNLNHPHAESTNNLNNAHHTHVAVPDHDRGDMSSSRDDLTWNNLEQ